MVNQLAMRLTYVDIWTAESNLHDTTTYLRYFTILCSIGSVMIVLKII